MNSERLRTSIELHPFYLGLGGFSLAAWALLAAWQQSAFSELLSHEAIESTHFPAAWRLPAFLAGWLLMIVAMMLPGSLPMLKRHVRPVHNRGERGQPAGLLVVGYVLIWGVFGLLAYLGDGAIHHWFAPGAALAAAAPVIAPAVVLAAGLYQFTPVKDRYLQHCRDSHSLNIPGAAGRLEPGGAVKLGLRLGAFCVGNCGLLMLLMFAVGHQRLDWMIAWSGVMAAERLAPGGRRLAWVVGIALVAWAVWLFLAAPHTGHRHA